MKRKRRSEQEIAPGVVAEIAFSLLIFFFIAISITEDQGILVKLPPMDPPVVQTDSENVLHVLVNSSNHYMVYGKLVELEEIQEKIKRVVMNASGLER
jgi:biopolymer transport protein ExbD